MEYGDAEPAGSSAPLEFLSLHSPQYSTYW